MIHIPTEGAVGLLFAFILAVLYGIVRVLIYVNKSVMPQVIELKTNVALLRAHADNNTARLNGQSQKIDTLLLNTTPGASPVTVNNGPGGTANVTEAPTDGAGDAP